MACTTGASATSLNPHYSNGLVDWVQTAQTGQADLLLIGDSTVLKNGGWASGLNTGFAGNSTFGLAGTGLLGGTNNNEGEGFFQFADDRAFADPNAFSGDRLFDWTIDLPPTQAGQAIGNNIHPFGIAKVNAGRGDWAVRGIQLDGSTLASNANYTFTAQLRADAAQGATSNYDLARRNTDGFTTVSGNTLTADGNFHSVSHGFSANTADTGNVQFSVRNMTDGLEMSSYRLRETDASGVTVTSWGYGGKSTRDFYDEQYTPLTEAFRQDTLNQIVEGGSGKLLVVITEAFNDINETLPSLTNGITPPNSADAFVDNLMAVITEVQTDWAAGGNNINDLSFLALGQYDTREHIEAYSTALRAAAQANAELSFFDLRSLTEGETQQQIESRLDSVNLHFANRESAAFYGSGLVDALTTVPEPTSAALLLTAGSFLLGRRRRA